MAYASPAVRLKSFIVLVAFGVNLFEPWLRILCVHQIQAGAGSRYQATHSVRDGDRRGKASGKGAITDVQGQFLRLRAFGARWNSPWWYWLQVGYKGSEATIMIVIMITPTILLASGRSPALESVVVEGIYKSRRAYRPLVSIGFLVKISLRPNPNHSVS